MRSIGVLLMLCFILPLHLSAAPHKSGEESKIARGRYLVKIAGCNDCHTQGYAQSEGKVPETEWLAGDSLGWHGPWGTTYAINLRAFVSNLTEDQWVQSQRVAKARPPMPTYVLQEMDEIDLRSIYAFIRSLGSHPRQNTAALPPGVKPSAPFYELVLPSPSGLQPHE